MMDPNGGLMMDPMSNDMHMMQDGPFHNDSGKSQKKTFLIILILVYYDF